MGLPQIQELKEILKALCLAYSSSGNLPRAVERKLQTMGKQTLIFVLKTENCYLYFEERAVESQEAKNKSILRVGFVLVV